MKQILFWVAIIICSKCFAQTKITKTIVADPRQGHSNESIQIFRITSLAPIFFREKFDKAFRQSDVIGNDFYGLQRIGTAYANNHPYERSDYVPVDGYKRTFTGKGYKYEFHGGTIDDDLTVYIETFDPLISHYTEKMKGYGEFFEKSLNIIEGEVDIHDVMHKFYKSPYKIPRTDVGIGNRRFADNISLYGAWVIERGSAGKKNNHEIHPLEQFWWRTDDLRYSKNIFNYYLNFAIDNSGRFESRGDFDDDDGELVEPWGKSPMDGIFALQFEIDRQKKEKLTYTINNISGKNAVAPFEDPKVHHLVIDNDTIISVIENMNDNIVSIDFTDVGYMHSPQQNPNKIKGFLVLKTKIRRTANDYAGSVRLHVNKKAESKMTRSYRIEFQKIKRIENNSFRYVDTERNKLYTYPQPVPAGFNEQSAFLELSYSGQSKKSIEIESLSKGQEYPLQGMSFIWKGSLINYIQAKVKCYNNRNKEILLGELVLNKNPPVSGQLEESDITTIQFEVPETAGPFKIRRDDNVEQNETGNETSYQVVTVGIFQIYFKITAIPEQANGGVITK